VNKQPDSKEKILEGRCECGRLLIRKTPKGFELKCPRCKRFHVLRFDGDQLLVSYDLETCPVLKVVEE